MTHDFKTDLRRSQRQALDPMWDEVYRRAFPTMVASVLVETLDLQKKGIDRTIILSSGLQIDINEKVQYVRGDSVFMEYLHVSNREQQVPGWIEKAQACALIAYAMMPARRCYMLPFWSLQLAWRNNKAKWIERYGAHDVPNTDYTTIGCWVPASVIMDFETGVEGARLILWGKQ